MTLDISAEDNASGSIEGIAASLSGMRMAAAAAGTAMAAIGVGGLAASASAAADFESAMVEVEKVTGATESQMDNFNEMVRDMATEIPLAQQELASLTADAARFGVEGEKNIRQFTEATARMATATNLNTETAGESLAKLAELTNTPISEIENLGSAINSLSNNAATSSQEIVDAMLRSSGALTQFGLNQREIAGLSTALNEVSESSQRAGTRLRRVAQELMDPKKAKNVASALGMNADEFTRMREESPVEVIRMMAQRMNEGGESADALRSTLSTTSRQAVAGLANNLDGLNESMERSNKSFEEGTSLQEEFDTQMDTFNSQVQLLKNRFRNVAIEIGTALLPAMNKLMDLIIPAIDKFAEFNKETDGMAGVAILAGTAITGLTVALAALAPLIKGTLLTVLGSLSGVLSGPLIAAVLAVGAAVAGLWYIWDNNIANIQGAVKNFVKSIKSSFGLLSDEINGIADTFKSAFTLSEQQTKQLGNTVEDISLMIKGALETVADVVNRLVVNHYQPMMKRIEKLTSKHLGPMVDEFIETFNVVVDRLQSFVGLFVQFWNAYGDDIMAIIKPVLKMLRLVFAQAFDAILTTVRVVLALIRGDWGDALDLILGFTNRTMGRLEEFIQAGLDAIVAYFEYAATVLGDVWDALFGGIESFLKRTWNSMVSFVTGIGHNDIYNAFYAVGQAIRGVFETLFNWLTGAGGALAGFIGDIVSYVQTDAKTDVKNAFITALDSVRTAFSNLVTDIIGEGGSVKSMIGDIASYLRSDAFEDLKEAAETMVDGIWSAFEGLYDGLIGNSLIPEMIGDIAEFLKGPGKRILKSAFNNMLGGMMSALGSFSEDVMETMGNIADGISETIGGAIDDAEERISSAINDLTSELDTAVSNAVSDAENYINNQIDDAQDALGNVSETTNDWVSESSDFVQDTTDNITDTGSDFVNNAGDTADDVVDTVNDTVNDWEDSASDSWDTATDYASDAWDSASDAASDTYDTVTDTANDAWDSATDFASDSYDSVTSSASDAFDAASDTVSNTTNTVTDTASNAADTVGSFFGFSNGGIVTSPVAGMIGETGKTEAVIPLDRLDSMLNTTYNAGAQTGGATGGHMTVTLNVEGDDELARIIRDNAEMVVEQDNQNKQDRLRRL